MLDALLSTAAAALEAARLHSSFRELADVDALTQLPNRRRSRATSRRSGSAATATSGR